MTQYLGTSAESPRAVRGVAMLPPMQHDPRESIIRRHGGYRSLLTFRLARLIYDITVRFCDRWVPRTSRTRDQMVQAARSGVQNIAEGSKAAGTSARTELKLTNVARASLEELRLDYEDFLRQRGLARWHEADHRRKALIASRPQSVEDFAAWIEKTRTAIPRIEACSKEIAANGALALLSVTGGLLGRQIAAQAQAFLRDGGFTEAMHRVRSQYRRREG